MKVRSMLSVLLYEMVEDVQKRTIDAFVRKYGYNFDPKNEKKRLKVLISKFDELKKHANEELYSDKNIHTRKYNFLKNEILQLKKKISSFENEKPYIDSLVRKHRRHLLNKHSKRV